MRVPFKYVKNTAIFEILISSFALGYMSQIYDIVYYTTKKKFARQIVSYRSRILGFSVHVFVQLYFI